MGTVKDLDKQKRKSIAIHLATLKVLQQDPDLRLVLLKRIQEKSLKRGDSRGWYKEWEHVLQDETLEAFRLVAEGRDNHSSDLRSVTPVGAILPPDVRMEALNNLT
jgi:hypothetical protein